MSARPAPPPTGRRDTSPSAPSQRRPGIDPLALEHLIGVRPSKPSLYAAWRDKSARRGHTIETLERISSALCAAPAGPVAVCDAVVEAAAHLFDARWAAMVFSRDYPGVGMARVFVHAGDCVIQGTRLEVKLRVFGQTQPVPAGMQHALVQIAREALFNVVHHAEAQHVWVTVRSVSIAGPRSLTPPARAALSTRRRASCPPRRPVPSRQIRRDRDSATRPVAAIATPNAATPTVTSSAPPVSGLTPSVAPA